MAREIVVTKDGEESRFALKKVDRSKLYGRRRRVHLGPDGEPCRRASLTSDGSMLLVSGMTAQGYFTAEGRWVPGSDLVGLDEDGNEAEAVPSTLGVAQELVGPIDASELLDLRVQSVYALDASEVSESLLSELSSGALYRFSFNYRAGYDASVAVLLMNTEEELFAVIGDVTTPAWQDVQAIIPIIDESDDDDDELDFEMF